MPETSHAGAAAVGGIPAVARDEADRLKDLKLSSLLAGHPDARRLPSGTWSVLPGDRRPRSTCGSGLVGAVRERVKRHGRLYIGLRRTFSPLHWSPAFRAELTRLLAANGPERLVVNLGSGPDRIRGRRDIVNVDLYDFAETDLVANVSELPLPGGSADLVLDFDLLEHVEDPGGLVAETLRVLRPGGTTLVFIPFMYPFHAAPGDHQRYTLEGLSRLFAGYAEARLGVAAGPTAALLLAAREFLATAVSLGSRTAYDATAMLFSAATFPLKYLDEALCRLPTSAPGAAAYFVSARK